MYFYAYLCVLMHFSADMGRDAYARVCLCVLASVCGGNMWTSKWIS